MTSHSNVSRNELTECLASYIVESPSQSYIRNAISACVVNAVFFVVGCTLNASVVATFSVSRQLRSKLTFFPILVLCSVDLATVAIVHPLFLIQASAEMTESPKCVYKVAYFSVLYIFPGMSASTLLVMNVERYINIVWPLWSIRVVRKNAKFMFACALLWLIILLNLACRLYKPSYSKAFVMVGISIACSLTFFIYASIFYVARRRRALTLTEERSTESNEELRSRNMTNFLHDLKIAKMYFIVVVLSFVCYLPIGVVVFATKYPWRENEAKRTLLSAVYTWTNTLISINSTLNCVVFFWANSMLRKEARKLLNRFYRTEQAGRHAHVGQVSR